MSNNSGTKKSSMDSLKRAVFENKVILLFVVLCIACAAIADTSLSYIATEVFARFARNACLVLALIIPCLAGLGMNFGIVVGAIAAQIAIFWVVHWGFTGMTGFILCAVLCIPLAIFFGILVGKLYNNTKGTEMIAGLVLGFFADGLYRLFVLYIIGGVIPFDDPNLLERGFGLRNTFDLTGNLKYALDDVTFLNVSVLLGVVCIGSAAITALHEKKMGVQADVKKTAAKVILGAVLFVFGLVGHRIPAVNQIFGSSRLILTDAALFGGIGLALYAIVMLVKNRAKEQTEGRGKLAVMAAGGVLLVLGTVIPAVRDIYQSIQLPTCTYVIIVAFCYFNNWIMSTRLGQNMRTVGQNRAVATSAGIDVDKTRIIATCISTVLAAWGQLIYLQNLGTFNTVQQQSNVGLYSIAAILVGGATVQKAENKHAVVGVILFHTLFVLAPLAATKLFGDAAVSEYIRMFISYGVIAVSLALHAWKSVAKKTED